MAYHNIGSIMDLFLSGIQPENYAWNVVRPLDV